MREYGILVQLILRYCLFDLRNQRLAFGRRNMSLIHRRIFYAKVGAANELVQLMHDDNSAMARFGSAINSLILTDHMAGR